MRMVNIREIRPTAELGHDLEGELHYLYEVNATLGAFREQYPEGHRLYEAHHSLFVALQHCMRVYAQCKPHVYVTALRESLDG